MVHRDTEDRENGRVEEDRIKNEQNREKGN